MILGTGTNVGKTWVTGALMEQLRSRGFRVVARKPAQSFAPGEVTDAHILGRASGEAPGDVCPPHRWYERPLAPPIAAQALGRPAFTVADLAGELAWPGQGDLDVGLIEGAGGVRSPLAIDGDAVDLAALWAPDLVVLVADAGLGALNLVRMSVDALAACPCPVAVYLNRYHQRDEVHRGNREWLELRMGLLVAVDVTALSDRLVP